MELLTSFLRVHRGIGFKLHVTALQSRAPSAVVRYQPVTVPCADLQHGLLLHMCCWLLARAALWESLVHISVVRAFCVTPMSSHSPNFSNPSPPCRGTKSPFPPRRSMERSRTIQAGLLDTPWGQWGWACVVTARHRPRPMAAGTGDVDSPFAHNLTNIHNQIMTFTASIWLRSSTRVHMQAEQPPPPPPPPPHTHTHTHIGRCRY